MDLSAIASNPDQKARQAQYLGVLEELVQRRDKDGVLRLASHVVSEDIPLAISKAILSASTDAVRTLPDDLHRAIAQEMLQIIQPRLTSFEDQAVRLREGMAEAFERSEDYLGAAHALAGIDLESTTRSATPAYKMGMYVRIAMLFLEEGDSVSADTYIKRAAPLAGSVRDAGLELQYKTCYARILDSKRKFLEASTRYYELSQAPAELVSEADRGRALEAAAACAILAGAGPQRSRVLAMLCKDERASGIGTFSLLNKVFLDRLLSAADVEAFRATLAPHQLAITGDGTTVLDRAAAEHNLVAVSRLYDNITFEQLGTLLGVTSARAEAMLAKMVQEGRIDARIDQEFQGAVFRSQSALGRWDKRISTICGLVNEAVDLIGAKGLLPA